MAGPCFGIGKKPPRRVGALPCENIGSGDYRDIKLTGIHRSGFKCKRKGL